MNEGAGKGKTDSPLEDWAGTERRRAFLINTGYVVVCLLLAYLTVRYLLQWLLPFVFAFFTALLLQRPVKWLGAKTGASRGYLAVVMVVSVILLLAGLVGFVGWQAVLRVVRFLSDETSMQNLLENIQGMLAEVQGFMDRLFASLPPEMTQGISGTMTEIGDGLAGMLPGLFAEMAGWLMSRLPAICVSFVVWFIASIFLTIDYGRIKEFLLRQLPERHRPLAEAIRELCYDTLFKMGRAYFLLMLLTFAELAVGLWILGVPHALFLAALIAVVDVLPVLGTGTVLLPWILFSLLGGNTSFAIGLGAVYGIVAFVRNILEPKLVSRQTGLHPLATLFFMFLGLRVTGSLAGLLLFPVAAIVIKRLQERGYIHLWKS